MLKQALRRLLWLGPTLFAITIPMFWVIAHATDSARGTLEPSLPLFFNSRPLGAREHALSAMRRAAANGGDASDGASTLVRLGGAALPHVLPALDALRPDARGRVALTLSPIARRMGIGSDTDFETPEAALLFWNRFWEEHSIDFKPQVVRRAVRRFADHPSALRANEVAELDTFALEELIDAMRPVRTAADVYRVRNIASLAARVTGNSWNVPDGASVGDAARVVQEWEDFWLDNRGEYVTFTGTRRLGATLVETRYGLWVEEFLEHGPSTLGKEHVFGETLRTRGLTTLWLLFSGVFLGYPIAVAAGVISAVRRRTFVDGLLFAVSVVGAGAGIVGVASLLATTSVSRLRFVAGAVAVALTTAAMASRHQRSIQAGVLELVPLRTSRAFGASAQRAIFLEQRLVLGQAVTRAAADLPGLLTAAFVAERAFGLQGLGGSAIRAAQEGDHGWLMALALLGAVVVSVARIAADLFQTALDPRVRPSAVRPGAHR